MPAPSPLLSALGWTMILTSIVVLGSFTYYLLCWHTNLPLPGRTSAIRRRLRRLQTLL